MPKLIPTTGGSVETTGVSALPFGTAFVVIARDIEQRRVVEEREEKKLAARVALRSHVFTLDLRKRQVRASSETNTMTCNHLGQLTRQTQPKLSQSVHREECTQCFDDQVRPFLSISRLR